MRADHSTGSFMTDIFLWFRDATIQTCSKMRIFCAALVYCQHLLRLLLITRHKTTWMLRYLHLRTSLIDLLLFLIEEW